MSFDDLPKDVQHDLHAMVFRAEIEADEADRRMFTTFGYNRGKMPALFLWLYVPFVLSAFTIIGLVVFDVPHDASLVTSPLLWWVILPPFALLPVTLFLFLKLRYVVRAIGIIITVAVVLTLMLALLHTIMGAVF